MQTKWCSEWRRKRPISALVVDSEPDFSLQPYAGTGLLVQLCCAGSHAHSLWLAVMPVKGHKQGAAAARLFFAAASWQLGGKMQYGTLLRS